MRDVILHIGLHKTATRFLQRAVFHRLDTEKFAVNPEPLFSTLRQAARHPGSQGAADEARVAAAEARAAADDRTIVVSDPSISGDMYSSHVDYAQNLALVHELFPDAYVIYFVRQHSDWLQSAYRQALVKGPGMPIERFLNFYEGAFRPRLARRVHGVRNVEALTLRFLEIYRGYADRFGPERVFLFRQEDLRRRPDDVYPRLAEALGLGELPSLPERVSGNRAFSALAIHLFFRGVRGQVTYPPPEAARADNKGRGGPWRSPLRRLRTTFVRHAFDRLVYRDWDLLAADGMRDQLDRQYSAEFEALSRVADEILEQGPGSNARELADASAARASQHA